MTRRADIVVGRHCMRLWLLARPWRQDLELVHLKLDKIANLNLPRFARHLKRLCLRQNNISVLDPEIFEQLTSLEELDLYDNKVKHVKVLESLKNLSVLDLSFNLLRAIPNGMEHLQSLHTVYFVQNKISTISGLQASMTLRSLELGSNRVRVGPFSPCEISGASCQL